jgi:hypothetical protein
MGILTQSRFAIVVALVLVPLMTWASLPAADARLTEAEAKASFLYNCALFVQWPGSGARDDLSLGIMGADRVAEVAESLQGRQVNGHALRVKVVTPTDDLRHYNIVFVGADVKVKPQLTALRDVPVLTVGESRDFTATGGVVRLYTDDQRLRFEINMTRVEGAGLQVSAKMLGLATIVR